MTAIWSVAGQHAKLRPFGTAGAGARRGARLAVVDAWEPVVTRTRACAITFIPVSVSAVRPVDSACRRGVLDPAGFDAKLRRPAQKRPACDMTTARPMPGAAGRCRVRELQKLG